MLGALFPPNGRYALLVALTASPDLFICAKQLFIDANGCAASLLVADPKEKYSASNQQSNQNTDDQRSYPSSMGFDAALLRAAPTPNQKKRLPVRSPS